MSQPVHLLRQSAEAELLGTDLLFPLQPDGAGRLVVVTGKANLEQAIRTILDTYQGEAIYDRKLGVGIEKYVHEDITKTAMVLPPMLRQELLIQETRLKSVLITAMADVDNRTLNLSIAYEAIAYGIKGNLAYALQLSEFTP